MNLKVALAQDFLSNLSKLPSSIQSKVLKWALKFQSDPTANGINYETIKGARDKNLRSVRIDQDWRGIVFKPDKGDVYVLMYVDKHDDAYRWAETRRVAINPVTGAMQLFAVEHAEAAPAAPAKPPAVAEAPAVTAPLYASLTNPELLSIGTPEELIPQVRNIRSEQDLDAMQERLPVEAYEGLFLIAAGDTVSEVLTARETRVDRKVDTEDFAAALQTAESQAHFVVVDDPDTMTAIINAPLAQWRVFLHPTQRKLADSDRNGPMRVLGGAGTGKTVLAIHRAKWIAENRLEEGQKVFFTTFTRNLAQDIEENLKTLCGQSVMQRIEVQNLDAWVHGFLRKHQYEYTIIFDRRKGPAADAWTLALAAADPSLGLPPGFYEEEFENVILAQGVTTRDEYRVARRRGRGTVLTRGKRDVIWPVFEEYRAGLSLRKLKEVDDAYRDAASLLKDKPTSYASIIVDETQDFGTQALKLLRAMVPPGTNDLFFVGDGHQRIYNRHRASMSECGIDIRGRGRKLYLNYRTTEQIRLAAVALLEGCEVDDLDEGSDEVRRYKSISRGPAPMLLQVPHLEDAFAKAVEVVSVALAARRSVCVMVPTKHEAGETLKALKAAGINSTLIGPTERDRAESSAARVATMHRAKGLEFDEVVLIAKPDRTPGSTQQFDKQRLEYVALTRAKRNATVIRLK
jgi:superfamily I DNA/RNA helicase/mRNA-degrading endonuclease RelE of RelBE toxin-antitoxin system